MTDPFRARPRYEPPPPTAEEEVWDDPEEVDDIPYSQLWEDGLDPVTFRCMICMEPIIQTISGTWVHEDTSAPHAPKIQIWEMSKSVVDGRFKAVSVSE